MFAEFEFNSICSGARDAATLMRALTSSRVKRRSAVSGTPKNENRPSVPRTADMPVPLTDTRTPCGLLFDMPTAIVTTPVTP